MSFAKLFTRQFSFKETFLFYCILFSLYLYPLIRNNIPFRDDQVRILRGNDWDTLGRRFADITMHILSFGFDKVINISPLTYFINIVLSSMVLTKVIFSIRLEKNIVNMLALSFIFLSPFYLQNYSYQYDNLTMSAGMCLCLLAFFHNWNSKIAVLQAGTLLFSAVLFFQPVINVFIALVIINYLMNLKDQKSDGILFIKGGIIYVSVLVVYFLFFKFIFNLSETNRSHIVPFSDMLNAIKNAIVIFGKFCEGLLYTPFSFLCLIACCIFVLSFITLIVKNKMAPGSFIIKVCLLPVLFLSIWGPFILLEETFARPRVFVVSGVILAFVFLFNLNSVEGLKRINMLLTLVMTICLFSIAYQYNNLNKEEFEYNKMLTEWISKDINSDKKLYSKNTVYINSHPDFSPAGQVIIENTPFLKYIQLPYYNWVSRYYANNRGIKNVYKDLTNIDDKYDWESICMKKDAKLVIENKYYNIYLIYNEQLPSLSKEHVSVWFKRNQDICRDRPNIVFHRNLFFIE